MINRAQLFLLPFVAGLSFMLLITSTAYTAELTVKPGKFDHFVITFPEKITAGEASLIKLVAIDAFGNVIRNFHELEKNIAVSVTGSAAVDPAILKPADFVHGAAIISLRNKVAENVLLTIADAGNPARSKTANVTILPGKIRLFTVRGPEKAQAGTSFEIELTAKDSFGNTVMDSIPGRNMNLAFGGDAEPKVDMPQILDFNNGISKVKLLSNKTGTMLVEVKDITTGSAGVSENIVIANAPFNSFKIFAPKDVTAGEPFEISLLAVDHLGNPVTNVFSSFSKIVLSMGKMGNVLATVPASKFLHGQAKVIVYHDKVESTPIKVTDDAKKYITQSDPINVLSPAPAKFVIKTPEAAVAGQKFKIQLTALAPTGNIMVHYNLVGPDVRLTSTGTGELTPGIVSAAEFVQGTAVVEVLYNKSETFAVLASSADQASQVIQVKPPAKTDKRPVAAKPKEELKTAATHRPFEITEITLDETPEKTTVRLHVPQIDKTISYKVSTQVLGGKKWIVLRTRQVANKVSKTFISESPFVGQVLLEEDQKEKGILVIKIEQLKRTRFYVSREKDTLNINLKHK
ncbi:MAG: hypothetical protein U1C55_01700 [Smithellaceae bacterium]|nr:hypothetical protein [Smithellaceae bacterium]